MRKAFLLLGTAALVAGSAASTAQAPTRGLNPRYVQEAQQDHPKLLEEFGGAETGPRASYVDSVGRRVAAYSGVTPQAYRFTVLNSAVENAFAVPGGYVYITRQLMALMDDESQLAFALGHEVGHVAGNHAQARQSYGKQQRHDYSCYAQLGHIYSHSSPVLSLNQLVVRRQHIQPARHLLAQPRSLEVQPVPFPPLRKRKHPHPAARDGALGGALRAQPAGRAHPGRHGERDRQLSAAAYGESTSVARVINAGGA